MPFFIIQFVWIVEDEAEIANLIRDTLKKRIFHALSALRPRKPETYCS